MGDDILKGLPCNIDDAKSFLTEKIAWGAWSATVLTRNCSKTQKVLSFAPGCFEDVSLPVDWLDLKYCPRFYSSKGTGAERFTHLLHTVPPNMAKATDILRTLVAVESIKDVNDLIDVINRIIPTNISSEE